jgi:hypothetical protein
MKKAQMSNISKLILVLIVVAIMILIIYKFVLGLGKTAVNATTMAPSLAPALWFFGKRFLKYK